MLDRNSRIRYVL